MTASSENNNTMVVPMKKQGGASEVCNSEIMQGRAPKVFKCLFMPVIIHTVPSEVFSANTVHVYRFVNI
jgi:hypothetical protein